MQASKRILVVDDEKLVCESCTSVLSEEGFHVETTMSARDGLRRIGEEPFEVLLADLRMPDIDGIELIERAKAKAPEIVVVVITGYPSVDTAVTTTRLGALEYIPKPFTPDELLSGVLRALQRHEENEASREAARITAETVDTAIESAGNKARGTAATRKQRRGMITVDLNRCMACLTCVVECGLAHLPRSPEGSPTIGDMERNARVQVEAVGTHCVPVRCRQCEDPPCAQVCPTGAISKAGPDLPVLIDDSRCIGCKSCLLVCPFGAITVKGGSNMIIKCDHCQGLLSPGEDPICVRSCPADALAFVTVEEAVAESRQAAAADIVRSSVKTSE
ncbi:MAG: response regulator [Planctomycetota bacterium]